MNQTYIKLNDGNKIPQFGFGVFLIPDGEETKEACRQAFSYGYRHIDTAHAYQNERSVGIAVKESGIPREEIWITSKLWYTNYGEGKTSVAIDKMLERLGMEYIDLLLLHQPLGDYVGAWKDMEKAVKEGKVKSIGISNFENNLESLLNNVNIMPSVIQVECHPYYQQMELRKKIASHGIIIESWYPIGHGDKSLLEEPIFLELGKKYGKTSAQIILRWHIQEGFVVFPKSTNPKHIKENINIFDFELTEEEMNKIRSLDKATRYFNVSLEELESYLSSYKLED